MPKVPFDGSYWVRPEQLLAGPFPAAPIPEITRLRMRALLKAGIRCTINLMEPDERDRNGSPFPTYEECFRELATLQGLEVQCHRVSIRDMGTPSKEDMVRLLDLIDSRLESKLPVYIHCLGGYGRTGTAVGCHLARHDLATGKAALEAIEQLRTGLYGISPQTPAQCEMVRRWKTGN